MISQGLPPSLIALACVIAACNLAATGVCVQATTGRIQGSPYPVASAGVNCTRSLFIVNTTAWSHDNVLMLETLQGITSRTCPQIYRNHGGSYTTWLADLTSKFAVATDDTYAMNPWGLVSHFKSEIKGYVLTNRDDASVNVALTVCAANEGWLAVTPANQAAADKAGLSQLADARSMTMLQALAKYGDDLTTSVSVVQAPTASTFLVDYGVFARSVTWYANNMSSPTATALRTRQATGTPVVGWGPDEYHTVTALSGRGQYIHAANWAVNMAALTNFFVPELKQQAPASPPPPPGNVHTVTFVTTDGDNVQWVLDGFEQSKWYGSPDRGKVNLGWTMSAAMAELAPSVLQHLYDTASNSAEGRDYFIAGVSGVGYTYPDVFPNNKVLTAFAELSNRMLAKADMSIVNVLAHTNDLPAMGPYTLQDHIDSVFLYLFSDYSGLHGKIEWSNGKPVIGGRWNLWSPNFENVTSLAKKLNAMPRDPTTSDGYSLIPVHVWSHTVADVVAVQALLDDGIEVVTPDVFVQRVTAHLKPPALDHHESQSTPALDHHESQSTPAGR